MQAANAWEQKQWAHNASKLEFLVLFAKVIELELAQRCSGT